MGYTEYTEKIEILKYSIENKSRVTTLSLCIKLKVSRRTLMRMIDHLRYKGIDIKYSKRDKKYFIQKS